METKEDIIIKLLKSWFETAEWDNQNFLHRNKVAKFLKYELQKVNRWKRPNKIVKKVVK